MGWATDFDESGPEHPIVQTIPPLELADNERRLARLTLSDDRLVFVRVEFFAERFNWPEAM